MKRGFMESALKVIIEHPGLTAIEIARKALASNPQLSDAQNPAQSLASTLSDQVNTGIEKRIRRQRGSDGFYHYFPASASPSIVSNQEIIVQIYLSAQELKDIDNLVAVGRFDNRGSAIKWSVTEGLKANRPYLDKVANVKNQIDRLKGEL